LRWGGVREPLLGNFLAFAPAERENHNVATTAQVLVADRDPALRRVLTQRLEAEGFAVKAFEDGAMLLADAGDGSLADAFVVTLEPDDPVLFSLRERARVPVLAMLPRDTSTTDALDVIDAGADDYVIKPFSPRELVTRLHAILRRTMATRPSLPQFVFDGLTIDPGRREVFVDGVQIDLPAKEFDLLAFLAASPKQVFTRSQLMTFVWGTDAAVNSSTVTEHIRRLRQRLEKDPRRPRWIQTVWSVGYRFNP
jgi:two-component system, OmpR family, phosphate regulon response regulator PhoB